MTLANDTIAFATLGVLVDDTVSAVPGTPTFTMATGSNAVTLTIDGDAVATNYVVYKGTTDNDWVAGGNRSGDGDVTVSSLTDDIPYVFTVYSVVSSINSLFAIPQTVTFSTTGDNDWDDSVDAMVLPMFNTFKKSGTYLPSGGGSRAINILITYRQDELSGLHGGTPVAEVTVHNDSTTGIARTELVQGRDKLTMPMRDGSTQSRLIRGIISTDYAWITLEVV